MPILPKDILPENPGTDNDIVQNPLVPMPEPIEEIQGPSNNEEIKSPYGDMSPDEILQYLGSQRENSPQGMSVNTPAPSITRAERHANKRYEHYIPGIDNEEFSAMNQSWMSQIGNGLIKGGITAATTFVNSFVSIPGALKAIGTGDFSGAYQNPASEWLMQIQENSEEWFPNFYTAYEKQHPVLSMFSSYGFANMFGDKFLKNLGFTAGAVGAAYVQSLLTAGIGSAL